MATSDTPRTCLNSPPIWPQHAAGFTLVELVAVILIVAVMAFFAMPSLSGSTTYRALAFHDDTVSALRYAQKSAVSHRRLVCAALTSTSVQLTIASANPAPTCTATTLNDPGGNAFYAKSGDTTNVQFSAFPATLYFQPSGLVTSDAAGALAVGSASEITFLNSTATSIAVWGATGYVN